jgi:hypothetical protein
MLHTMSIHNSNQPLTSEKERRIEREILHNPNQPLTREKERRIKRETFAKLKQKRYVT